MLDVVELESDVFPIAATVPDTRPRDAIRVGGVLVSSNFPVVSRILKVVERPHETLLGVGLSN